ncbi:hypothetical protein DFH29DRAFT_1005451 [Suillus ampliporus]|nr:hypothetical protein DFH29DRAFT_1005451 [Suillus ampliporus]
MSDYAPYVTTQPSCNWIEDMMAHVQADRLSEFSTFGSSDDLSIYWEPDLSSLPSSPPPSSFKPPPTLPSPPTSSPSAKPLLRFGDTDTLCTFLTHHQGAVLEQSQTLEQPSNDDIVGIHIGRPDEQKENKSVQAEAGHIRAIRARAFRTTSTRQTCKRKIEDIEHNTNQETLDISLNLAPVKTGSAFAGRKQVQTGRRSST